MCLNKKFKMDCEHDTIVFFKCIKCGVQMEKHKGPVNKKPTIMHINNFNIPDSIRDRALDIYSRMNIEPKKSAKKRELIFFLIYSAYKEEGIPIEPKRLAKIIGINFSSIGKSHSAFSYSTTGYKPPIMIGDPLKLIPEISASLGNLSLEIVNNIIEFAKKILKANPSLKDHSPQKLATAFIHSYLELNEYSMNKHVLCEIVNVTDGTLNAMIKTIKNVHMPQNS